MGLSICIYWIHNKKYNLKVTFRQKSSSGYALLVTPGTYNDKIDNMKMDYFTEVIEVGVQLNATQTNPVTIVSSDAGGDMYTF